MTSTPLPATAGDAALASWRSAVAGGAGAALTWFAARRGFVISDEMSLAVAGFAGAVATGAYHVVASWLQRRWLVLRQTHPRWARVLALPVAVLLGSIKSATYLPDLRSGERLAAVSTDPDSGERLVRYL